VCDVPAGVCLKACTTDADCGFGLVCDPSFGGCIFGTTTVCSTDGDCPPGQVCNDLSPGACCSVAGVPCEDDSDCCTGACSNGACL
jgi:hypothetical protein